MKARVVRIDPLAPRTELLSEAAEQLRQGRLVAFPTETVYGLGARADDGESVRKIYRAKGRPSSNPLIVHVHNVEQARRWSSAWPPMADALAKAFWPGPLTLVVPRNPALPDELSAGLPSVALRVPQHPVALALLAELALPVAAPSANRSNALSPTSAEHVQESLGDAEDLAMILDGGPCSLGIESTVVALSALAPPRLLRPGSLPVAALRSVLPTLEVLVPGLVHEHAAASPGLSRKHYAPKVPLWLVATEGLEAAVEARRRQGLRVAVLSLRELRWTPSSAVCVTALPPEAQRYAAALFHALHSLQHDHDEILVEEPPRDDEAWLAVWDRLLRASSGRFDDSSQNP